MQPTWRAHLVALSTVAAITLAPLAVSAGAQDTAPTDPPAAMQPDDDDLRAFAQASLEVEALYDVWAARVAEAQNEEEAEQLRQQAAAEMEAVVHEQGLTTEEYNGIYQLGACPRNHSRLWWRISCRV